MWVMRQKGVSKAEGLGSANLVVELGLLRVTRILGGDGRNEGEAQREQREEYPHRVLDQQRRGLGRAEGGVGI